MGMSGATGRGRPFQSEEPLPQIGGSLFFVVNIALPKI
jgi:hypothetical protein